ncbi:MAG: hypothetical protein HUU20_28540 [Pirellulales bacterium]|nr:hypothetical protein [Pirellulales bacterium]
MTCKHLRDLYTLCESHNLKLSSSELIRLVCPQCGVEEVCPSVLTEEYEKRHDMDESGCSPHDSADEDT